MLVHGVDRHPRICTLTAVTLLVFMIPRGGFAQASSPPDPAAAPQTGAQSSAAPSNDSYFPEPHFIRKPIDLAVRVFGEDGVTQKSGFYPDVSNMNTGAGWVSLGPGYRKYLFNNQVLMDGSAAVSWHLYKRVQGRIEVPSVGSDRLTVGLQAMWLDQTQVNYFGPGRDSLEDDRSQYRIKTTDTVGYATFRFNESLYVDGRLGWLDRPDLEQPGGSFIPDLPSTLVLFADQPGVSGTQPSFLHGEVALTADTRDYKNHPTSGGLYRAALTLYRDQDAGTFSFNEYQAEALRLVPVRGKRWVLAFRGWLVLTDVPEGHQIPIYLQPSVGGNNTLRAFRTYRFHDENALVLNGESRWAVFEHMDLAAFVDAGNVAARAGDLNLAKTSFGGGVRLHTVRTTVARLDVAYGDEGWHVLFRTTEPLRLARISRRMADLPFAP
jgi:surface antigen Omp85-like protein